MVVNFHGDFHPPGIESVKNHQQKTSTRIGKQPTGIGKQFGGFLKAHPNRGHLQILSRTNPT